MHLYDIIKSTKDFLQIAYLTFHCYSEQSTMIEWLLERKEIVNIARIDVELVRFFSLFFSEDKLVFWIKYSWLLQLLNFVYLMLTKTSLLLLLHLSSFSFPLLPTHTPNPSHPSRLSLLLWAPLFIFPTLSLLSLKLNMNNIFVCNSE